MDLLALCFEKSRGTRESEGSRGRGARATRGKASSHSSPVLSPTLPHSPLPSPPTIIPHPPTNPPLSAPTNLGACASALCIASNSHRREGIFGTREPALEAERRARRLASFAIYALPKPRSSSPPSRDLLPTAAELASLSILLAWARCAAELGDCHSGDVEGSPRTAPPSHLQEPRGTIGGSSPQLQRRTRGPVTTVSAHSSAAHFNQDPLSVRSSRSAREADNSFTVLTAVCSLSSGNPSARRPTSVSRAGHGAVEGVCGVGRWL